MKTKFANLNSHTFVSGQAYTNTGGANSVYTKVDNQTLNKDPTYRSDQYREMWELENSKLTFTGTTTPPEVSLATLIRIVYFGDFNYKKSGEFNGGTLAEYQAVTHTEIFIHVYDIHISVCAYIGLYRCMHICMYTARIATTCLDLTKFLQEEHVFISNRLLGRISTSHVSRNHKERTHRMTL